MMKVGLQVADHMIIVGSTVCEELMFIPKVMSH